MLVFQHKTPAKNLFCLYLDRRISTRFFANTKQTPKLLFLVKEYLEIIQNHK